MINKQKSLEYIERTRNAVSNLKTSVYRNNSEEYETRFEKLESLIDSLEMMIQAEPGSELGKSYNGL